MCSIYSLDMKWKEFLSYVAELNETTNRNNPGTSSYYRLGLGRLPHFMSESPLLSRTRIVTSLSLEFDDSKAFFSTVSPQKS